MSGALDVLIVATGWLHVLLAPYTKVEESFNLHAVHDILMYGVNPSALPHYDHFINPGPVPRSFIGSLLLAYLSTPFIHLAHALGFIQNKFDLQIIVRLTLSTLSTLTLVLLRRRVQSRYGRPTSLFFTLLSISQFHFMFWCGRTLPNIFALILVNLSLYFLIPPNPQRPSPSPSSTTIALSLLTFTCITLRAELILLLGPLALQFLILRRTTFSQLFRIALLVGLPSIAATVLVDSYFWDKLVWPEFGGIWFNVIEGKSSDWGISPWHYYFTSSLPKLLLSSLPLTLLSLRDPRAPPLLLPPLFFISLLSFLAHKEWRFIIYVIPWFNILAARGARVLYSPPPRIPKRLSMLFLTSLISINFILTSLLTLSSISNYPGGEALRTFNEIYKAETSVNVYITNLAAQTGSSLFLQSYSPPHFSSSPPLLSNKNWTYTKAPSLASPNDYTHLILENDPSSFPFISPTEWEVRATIPAFEEWVLEVDLGEVKGHLKGREWGAVGRVLRRAMGRGVGRMVKEEKLWVLERR
ncbi:glycosyltransferase family 22 protein [Jaapia argillacea MUCL 33604]|uniref:Mannosyltransferase n=1 Tax=Jaapia argillacea MUCL 33604 TaxID=933084 RepID=A0A067PFM1_9AGAM|nr:glycosyltransferase family 22 protein [Jaapia argillacea MUCL 33604]